MSPRTGLDLNTILDTAANIVDTQGIDQITLASLAKKLNIRPPSLYNHVEGLNDLKKKLAIYSIKLLYNELTQAAIGRSGDDAVRAVGKAYTAFATSHPGLYEASLQAPTSQDDEDEYTLTSNKIVELLVRVLQAYDLDDEMAIHAIRGLRSILHGFISLKQKGAFGLPLDTEESFRLLIDTFLTGIHQMKDESFN